MDHYQELTCGCLRAGFIFHTFHILFPNSTVIISIFSNFPFSDSDYDDRNPAMHSEIRLRREGVSMMWPLTHISTGLDPRRGMITANGI